MNILMLAPQPFFQERGTPIAVKNLIEVLSREGHSLDAVVFHEGDEVELTGVRLHRTRHLSWVKNIPPGFSWKKLVCDIFLLFKAISLCRHRKFDLTHAVEESVFIALILKWVFRIPYVYDMDSSLPDQLLDKFWFLKPLAPVLRFAERLVVRHSQGVVAVCNTLEDAVTKHSSSTPVVRVEDVSLVEAEVSPSLKVEDWIDISGPTVMYVGNLQGYQGIDLLLESFLHAYHRHRDLQLAIIGGSSADIAKYSRMATKYAIDDRTHFLGPRPVDKLGEYLRQADILVSPRTQGTNTPMKIFSYLESGVPVVATALKMHTQVLNTDVAVLTAATPLELARGIDVLLNDRDFRDRISKSARDHVRNTYSSEVMEGKLAMFYEWIEEEVTASDEPSPMTL